MNRIYKPYWEWEEHRKGMYSSDFTEKDVKKALAFMRNKDLFFKNMHIVVDKWNNAMMHNLTNTSKNRLAFIGQCACCHALNIPSSATKIAWKELSDDLKNEANKIAKICLEKWILAHEKKNN